MNIIDPNYANPQTYLKTWVPTHSIGKKHISKLQIAEITAAIATLAFITLISPSFVFLAAGIGFSLYKNQRITLYNPRVKEICLVWEQCTEHVPAREFQIFIHPDIVKSKLERANHLAKDCENSLKDRDFGLKLYESILPWAPFLKRVRVAKEGEQCYYAIRSFELESAWVAQTQGRRDHMEDVVLGSSFAVKMGGSPYLVNMLAVLDGHNGLPNLDGEILKCTLAEYLRRHNQIEYTITGTFNALKLTAVKLHSLISSQRLGSTCVIAMQIGKRLWIANTGDSRAFLVNVDGTTKTLTVDAHVQGAGHGVYQSNPLDMQYVGPSLMREAILDHRQLFTQRGSKLAMLRSLGDHHFTGKSARPKITTHDMDGNERFLVMVSDGIPDVGRNREVGAFIDDLYKNNNNLQAIAAKTVEMALLRGSRDNLTCLVKSLESVINISNEKD